MRAIVLLSLVIILTACGKPDNAPGPGGVTVGEAKALDEAAEMIESQRLPTEALALPPLQPAQTAPTAQTNAVPPKR